MSRAQLTSTDQQNSGGPVSPFVAGKNKIINGDFGIWQRGTSFAINTATVSFAADRFATYSEFTGGSITVSRQTFTPATAPVSGYESQYYLRWAQSATTGGTNPTSGVSQNIEDVRTFAGQTVTVSFWAKADASRTITTAYEQYCGTSGSGYISGSIGSYSVTTSWQRFTTTFTVPSLSGKTLGANSRLQINWSFPLNTTATIDIWGVQLEAGSVATPFTTATGTLSGELMACQRYYERWQAASNNDEFFVGGAFNTIYLLARAQYIVQKRIAPSIAVSNYTNFTSYGNNMGNTLTGLAASSINSQFCRFDVSGTWVTGLAYDVRSNTSSAYIEFSAEL